MTKNVLRGLRAVALTGTLVLSSGAAFAENSIKLGVLEDQSGDFAAATIGKVHAIQLAADEINKAGGIAGRPLELVTYDTQSDNTRYQEFMRRVLQRDKVDVVFAGFSSASREAYRPIVDQFNGFAFYNNQYEGGVCDGHMIVTGAVPEPDRPMPQPAISVGLSIGPICNSIARVSRNSSASGISFQANRGTPMSTVETSG